MAGLLGITVIRAILRSRQGDALRHGAAPGTAFLDGYHAGLLVTVAMVAAGAVISYLALRGAPTAAQALAPEPAPAAPAPPQELAGSAHR